MIAVELCVKGWRGRPPFGTPSALSFYPIFRATSRKKRVYAVTASTLLSRASAAL
jgi:hypothetical protein